MSRFISSILGDNEYLPNLVNFPKPIISLLSKFSYVKFRSDEYKDRKLYALAVKALLSHVF